MSNTWDVVIAGGAVTGSSIAWHLATHPGFKGRVLVLEPDPTYQRSASALSAGSIRQQFSQPVNIAISLYGITFLRGLGEKLRVGDDCPEIGLKEGGYLYLGDHRHVSLFRENNLAQRALGADAILLDEGALRAHFPWLETSDLALGSFGRNGEGWFDGYGLMMAFRKAARALGVTYLEARAIGFERRGRRVERIMLEQGEPISCGAMVNAAGASGARALCKALDMSIPVFAKKRSVFSFSCKTSLPRHPLIIDKGGVWWRPEGDGFIAGFSPDDLDDKDHGQDFEVDWPLFEETIWPALAHRVPAFEAIRPGRAWAGHYDTNLFDHNALVGLITGTDNAYLACGFSGHGLQQSPAIGRGLAELIVEGQYRSLDLSELGMDRITKGHPLLERNVI
jgi:glycine/D-amino acid oxidase-like deaminating enzyme